MPLVEFDPEEKKGSPFDFPKLKLRHGERARVNVLQEKPLADFVHTFRAPVIINGRAETEQVRQGDTLVTRMKMSFIRQSVCLGDYGTLKERGLDPELCPACRASVANSDAIPQPQRRFAAHIIKYETKPGGFEVAEPFQVTVVAWSFPQRTFDKLITLLEEQEPKKLFHHDLLLGPCENEGFQKFDIQMSAKAAWIETEERKARTVEVWKNNQAPDLSAFLGWKQSPEQMSEDVNIVLLRHRQAQGVSTPEAQVDESSVDSLLDEMSASPPSAAEPEPTTSVDDLLSVEAPAADPNGGQEKPVSFEDLLKDIEQK
jgi:hypothetical protein